MPVESASRYVREGERKITPQLVDGLNRGLEFFRSKEPPLPMTGKIPEIHDALTHHDTLILEAATGSGKSTVGPLIALENAIRRNSTGRILITQPRKDAAEGIATYVGKQIGEQYVGYRFKGAPSTIGPETRLEFIMERTLLNELRKDIKLKDVDTVILDEIHEGNLDIDKSLLALEISQQERAKAGLPPLKLILTSATLDPEMLKKRFKGSVHVEVPGRMFKVDRHFENVPIPREQLIERGAQKVAEIIENGAEGDILMFWPGKNEIDEEALALARYVNDPNIKVVSLMGGEDSGNIEKIKQAKTNTKTIFLASKVAETSLTFDNVKVVVDSGLDRSTVFDPNTGITTLTTFDNSQSSAIQRAGRAGRVSEGDVYFLYTEEQFNGRKVYTDPKILQTDLTETLFLMKSLNIPLDKVPFVNKPSSEQIYHAMSVLFTLGAIDNKGNLTEIGNEMMKYNIDPRLARILVEGDKRGCLEDVSVLVSILAGEKSVFDAERNTKFAQKYQQFLIPGFENNDFATLINIWNEYLQNARGEERGKKWGRDNGIKTYQLHEASSIRNELFRDNGKVLRNQKIDTTEDNLKKIMECMARGLVDNVIRQQGDRYIKVFGGTPITLGNTVINNSTPPDYFISGRMNGNEKAGKVFAEYNMAISKESYDVIIDEINQRQIGKIVEDTVSEEVNKDLVNNNIEQAPENTIKKQTAVEPSHEGIPPHEKHTSHESHDHVVLHQKDMNVFQKIGNKIRNFVDKLLRLLRIRR